MNSPNCSSETEYSTFPVAQDYRPTPSEEPRSEIISVPVLGLLQRGQAAS